MPRFWGRNAGARTNAGTVIPAGGGWQSPPAGGGGGGGGVVAPFPPAASNYTVPGGATVVTDAATLATALASGTPQDILLKNGSYTRTTQLVPAAAHRLYGESPTGVVLNFGLMWSAQSNWKVKGLTINLPDAAHGAVDSGRGINGGIVGWYGTGNNWEVSDCYITGNSVAYAGIDTGSLQGCIIQRCDISGFTDEGLRLSDNSRASTKVMGTITDLNISNIHRASAGSAGGTAEAGLWLAVPVTNTIDRIKIRNCGWMGIWTGNVAQNIVLNNIDIDSLLAGGDRVGIYMEHTSRFITVQNFTIGPTCRVGVNSEWDYGLSVGLSGSHTFPTGTINLNESPASLAASGSVFIGNPGSSITSVSYTGKSGNTLTGCTGGSGTYGSGTMVSGTGTLDPTGVSGGRAGWNNVYQNGTMSTNVASGAGFFFDNGTMNPTVTGVTFVSAAGNPCIHDRTNNPQSTNSGNSNLTQSGNNFGALTPIVYG